MTPRHGGFAVIERVDLGKHLGTFKDVHEHKHAGIVVYIDAVDTLVDETSARSASALLYN